MKTYHETVNFLVLSSAYRFTSGDSWSLTGMFVMQSVSFGTQEMSCHLVMTSSQKAIIIISRLPYMSPSVST